MGRNKFDLIIPVVFKDYGMLSRVLRYVMKYIYPDNIHHYGYEVPEVLAQRSPEDESGRRECIVAGFVLFPNKEPAQAKW